MSKYIQDKYFKLTKIFYIFENYSYNRLGRWCHKGIPRCNELVIEKKLNLRY